MNAIVLSHGKRINSFFERKKKKFFLSRFSGIRKEIFDVQNTLNLSKWSFESLLNENVVHEANKNAAEMFVKRIKLHTRWRWMQDFIFFLSLNVLNYFSNDSILKSRRPVYFHSVVTFHHKLFFYTILEWKSSLDIEMYSWIVRKQKDKIQCSVTRILFVFLFYVWISFTPLFITHTIWRSASVCVCV